MCLVSEAVTVVYMTAAASLFFYLPNSLIMATSHSFFGIRKGSTKSLTFSEFNGKQVTKDRVSTVKNPKTPAQMAQRACFSTVTTAYRTLSEICDHSFEGVSGKSANRDVFVSRNMELLRSRSNSFAPKGWEYIVPNNYLMSDGSLTLNGTIDGSNGTLTNWNETFVWPYSISKVIGWDTLFYDIDSFTWQQFADLTGMKAGEQLTFVQIQRPYDENYKERIILCDYDVKLARIVFPAAAKMNLPAFKQIGEFVDWTFQLINYDENSENLDFLYFDTFLKGLGFKTDFPDAGEKYYICMGASLIRSAYIDGMWRRSKAFLSTVVDNEDVKAELSMQTILPTWNPASAPYLNGASSMNIPEPWR